MQRDRKSILLVEDEYLIALMEQNELEERGYIVHRAENGDKAVKIILDGIFPADLILMDIDLGAGIDGTQAAEKILNLKDIPILFLSSHTELEVVEKTEKITSYGYVVKNTGIVVLDASIKMALKLFDAKMERRKAEEALRLDTMRRERQAALIAQMALSRHLTEGDVREFVEELTESIALTLEMDRVSVWLFSDDVSELVSIDLYESSCARHTSGVALKRREFQNEFEALLIAPYVDAHDALTDPRTAGYVESYLKPNRITSMLDVSIRIEGRSLGVLCFEHLKTPRRWRADEISIALQLADQLALVILHRDRKQAQAEIATQRERLRSIAANVPGVVYQFYALPTGEYGMTYVSEHAAEMFEFQDDIDTFFTRFVDCVHPEDRNAFMTSIQEVLATNSPWHYEGRFVKPSGGILWFSGASNPIRLPDRIIFNGLLLDITERKLAEDALRRSDSLFQSMLSAIPDMVSVHDRDMRIVYSNWNGFGAISPDSRKIGAKCHLAYRGYETICPDCQARNVIRSKKPFQSEAKLPDDRWVDLRVIPILDENGECNLFVEWVRDITESKRAVEIIRVNEENLRVTLDSIGDAVIATDIAGRVMRMNPVAERLTGWKSSEGEGRLLSEVFKIINAHNRKPAENPVYRVLSSGEIVGLANHTVLIGRDGKEYQIADSVALPRSAEPVRGKGLILLVDDEAVIRATGEALLEELGYDVILAENGRLAVDLFRDRAQDINLVILDMIMPEMNGRDCFTALRAIRSDIPIALSSGFTRSEDLADLKQRGLSGFIQKPFYSSELSWVVADAIGGRRNL